MLSKQRHENVDIKSFVAYGEHSHNKRYPLKVHSSG
uniref:Uncharacterized protein n=1 Tax=mine drainage metagenome TaxID=410659 RepID=E6QB95_9ZZZZ